MTTLYAMLGAYLVGALPTGYLLVRALTGHNIKQLGSGNSGATNVGRLLGWQGFAAVFLIDAGKSWAYLWYTTAGDSAFNAQIACMLVVGNIFSCFLHFSGGKGFATYLGFLFYRVFVMGAWYVVVAVPLAFAVVLALTRRVGIASVAAVVVSTVLLRTTVPMVWLSCMLALIVYAHRSNVRSWLTRNA